MIPIVQRRVQEIAIDLLDDPEFAMRETVDDVKFEELVDSIRLNGVQVPLIVEQRGTRYQISAGHRRAMACRKLGASTVPCDVRQPGELDTEAIKIIENDDREKANPAETALYLHRLLERRANGDVEQLCAIVRRPRKYVEDRLLLFQGDGDVFEALKHRKIGLGVALELNLITDIGYRRLHLENATKFGMTIEAAKYARRDANALINRSERTPNGGAAGAELNQQPASLADVCHVCRRSDHLERMRFIRVHEHCDLAILEPLLVPFRQANADGHNG